MWNFYLPVELHFGEKRIADLSHIMENKGLQNAFIICDETSVKLGLAAKIKAYAQGRVIGCFSGVNPNPTVNNIEDGLKAMKELPVESIIALGGGSSIDCAKAIAACVKLGVTGKQLLDIDRISDGLPLIIIPTTAGTASELTQGAVISDPERDLKKALFGPGLFATVAIDDPELTYSCPNFVTASSGIDVLAHALDSLTSMKTNASTIGAAVYAAKTTFQYLERAYDDGTDTIARCHMMEACVAAGLAFSQTGTTGSHACSYYLTSHYHMPHGEACAFTLDWWFRENAKVRPELDEYAKMMGFADADAVAERIAEMKEHLHLRSTFSNLIHDEKEIELIADQAMAAGNMSNNVWKATRNDVIRLFRSKL